MKEKEKRKEEFGEEFNEEFKSGDALLERNSPPVIEPDGYVDSEILAAEDKNIGGSGENSAISENSAPSEGEAPNGGATENTENANGLNAAEGEIKEAVAESEEGEREGKNNSENNLNTVPQPKKKKYGWIGYIILLAAIALGIYLMFKVVYDMGDDIKAFDEVIKASDWKFAVITIAVVLIIFICQSLQYSVIMKTTTGKFHIGAGVKVAFVGKFYDNVTPFATGGQPMQIYYLNKKGLNGGTASAVVMIKYFVWMLTWIIICMLFMACCTGVLREHVPSSTSRLYMLIMGWVGLAVNTALPLLVILFVALPKFSKALVRALIIVGHKLKIVKRPGKAYYKIAKIVHDFRASFRIMSKNPIGFIALILLCGVEILLTFSFPYYVMKMFAGLTPADGMDILIEVTAINIYAAMSVCIVPTPGNAGAIEVVVTAAFASVANSVLLWTVFAWRFGTFYIYIIIGLVMTVYDFINKLVKSRKNKKAEKT